MGDRGAITMARQGHETPTVLQLKSEKHTPFRVAGHGTRVMMARFGQL